MIRGRYNNVVLINAGVFKLENISIRLAERRDVPELIEMLYNFQDYFNNECGDNLRFPNRKDLERDMVRLHFSEHPMLQTLVAETDKNRIAGRISFYRGWGASWYLRFHLSGLFVRDEYRSMGIADKLFERLIEIAKSERAKKIVWTVWRPNKRARKFYERIGGKFLALGSPAKGDPDDDLSMEYRLRY
jgi:ribosomal protein S18 acetylase RimI-like enzyme